MSDGADKKLTQGEIAREFTGHFLYREMIEMIKERIGELDQENCEFIKANIGRINEPEFQMDLAKEIYKEENFQELLDMIENHFTGKVHLK